MRISDWSSDVCSSDLVVRRQFLAVLGADEDDLRKGCLQLGPLRAIADHHLGAGQRQLEEGADVLLHRNAADVEVDRPRQPQQGLSLRRVGAEDRKRTRLNSQSLMRSSYSVFCLKKKTNNNVRYS